MHDDRLTLLTHALPLVPFDGWSDYTLREAGRRAELSDASTKKAFPGGAVECIEYFFAQADEHLTRNFPENVVAPLRMPERIEKLVLARFDYFWPHREAVRRAVASLALPWNLARKWQLLFNAVDGIWRLAGDTSTDFNFYTKRMTLAAVYASTLTFWLDDHSEHQVETRAFLKRRLANVAEFGKMKKRCKEALTLR